MVSEKRCQPYSPGESPDATWDQRHDARKERGEIAD
jgi:hypothetical protein